MTPDTLHLHYNTGTQTYPHGTWKPADHISQEIALQHFSGGFIEIPFHRLDEVVYIAGMHNWDVKTHNSPLRIEPSEVES